MSLPRYFLPDHPVLTEVYSKADLRAMLQSGELSRSEIVVDDETGLGHLLGDLLAAPYPDATGPPSQTTSGSRPRTPVRQEFRADTPLPRGPSRGENPDADEEEDFEEAEEDIGPCLEEAAGEDEDEFPEPRASRTPAGAEQGPDESRDPAIPMLPSRGGEEILFMGHPSWFAYPRSLVVSSACVAGAFWCFTQDYGLEWVVLLGCLAALILVFVSLDRTTTTYFVTTRRVEMEFGLVGRNSKEVRISDIRAIDVRQRSYAALLGIGNVDFDSSASAGAEVRFKDVRRPHDIKQLVRQLQG